MLQMDLHLVIFLVKVTLGRWLHARIYYLVSRIIYQLLSRVHVRLRSFGFLLRQWTRHAWLLKQ